MLNWKNNKNVSKINTNLIYRKSEPQEVRLNVIGNNRPKIKNNH